MHFYFSRCIEKHMTGSADDTENILDYLFNFLKGFSTMCEYWVGKVDSSLSILLHEEAYWSYTFTKIFQKQSVFCLWNNFWSFLFFGIFLAKNFFLIHSGILHACRLCVACVNLITSLNAYKIQVQGRVSYISSPTSLLPSLSWWASSFSLSSLSSVILNLAIM